MIKFKEIIRKKIILFFDSTTYINFFSKKSYFDFVTKKLRNMYFSALAKNDLNPIKKMQKIFVTDDKKIEIFIDTHDLSHIGQIANPEWESKVFNYYDKLNYKNLSFIDIGANIGCHTLYFYNFFNFNKLIYIEPNIKCVEIFKKTLSIQKDNKRDKVFILDKVISEKNEYLDLKYFKNNSGSGSIVNYFGKESKKNTMLESPFEFNSIKVESLTIANLFSEINKTDDVVLKMDIQGAEPRVLNQIGDIISEYNIRLCFFEINDFDENVMKQALKKFNGKYLLKNLDNSLIDENNIKKYMKEILVLEKIF